MNFDLVDGQISNLNQSKNSTKPQIRQIALEKEIICQ